MTRAEFFATIAAAVTAATNGTAAQPKEVTRGGLYAIEIPRTLSNRAHESIREALRPFEKQFGVKFIVLDGGARLRDPRAPVININMPRLLPLSVNEVRFLEDLNPVDLT